MQRLSIILLLLLVLSAPVLAQDVDGDGTVAPPAEPAPDPNAPADPNAPLIVGKDEALPGPPVKGQPKCECCGLYAAVSPTRIEAVVVRNGGPKEIAQYESIPCLLRDTAKEGNALVRFNIIDYTTAGSETEVMLDGGEAFYVYGARAIPGSSAPYIAAFADEGKARDALQWLDGDTSLSYGGLLKRWEADLVAVAAAGDSRLPIDAVIPPGEDYFVCPCAAGDCDDIRADAEGVCPKCGMALVRRTEKLRLQRARFALQQAAEEDAADGR
jgi:hypothetical protein